MDDLAELPAAELAALPALEGLGDGHESPTQFFLVCVRGVLTQEALDPLGRVHHTLPPSTHTLSGGTKRRPLKRIVERELRQVSSQGRLGVGRLPESRN